MTVIVHRDRNFKYTTIKSHGLETLRKVQRELCLSLLLLAEKGVSAVRAQSGCLGEVQVLAMQVGYVGKVLKWLSASCKILRLIVLHSPVRLVYYKS